MIRIELAWGPWDGRRFELASPPTKQPSGCDGGFHYVYHWYGKTTVGTDDGLTRRLYELAAAIPLDTAHPSTQGGEQ